jgi:LPXTG-motif cell wall-anchored protein
MNTLRKLITTAASILAMCSGAFAATEYLNVDENSFKGDGSLTFTCNVEGVAVDGVEFSLYKIADAFIEDDHIFYYSKADDGSYILLDDFDDMTAIELYDYAANCNKDDYEVYATAVSDENGVAKFDIDNYGMYLVVQTGATGSAEHYTEYSQFLMSVPNVSEVDNELVYNVESYPKATIVDTYVPETPKTPNSPKTGDATSIGLLILFAVCSLAGIIILIKKRKEP